MGRFWKQGIALLALAAAVGLWYVSPSLAAKPGGGGGGGDLPSGVIYFQVSNVTSMNGDGSGKSTVLAGYWGLPFEPSDDRHGGGRWFLYTPGRVLAAIKDDGTRVILNAPGDDGDWEVRNDGKVRWVFDLQAALAGNGTDGLVAWSADQWSDDQIVASAVCMAPVVFDPESGDIIGLDLTAVLRFYNVSRDYDFSPDGTEIVFSDRTAPERGLLSIYDRLNDLLVPLPVENGIDPSWSPDGTSIVFADRRELIDHIVTLGLAAMSEKVLATARRQNPLEGEYLYRPSWSPQSAHVIYTKGNTKGYKEEYHIWRIGAAGGQAVNLTRDLVTTSFGVWILGWR